jgi:hypothetical protein
MISHPKNLKEMANKLIKVDKLSLTLNQAPRHKEEWGSGGTAPRILNLGAVCMWMVSFTP